MLKTCNKCGLELTIDNFQKHKSRKDGLQSICKECMKKTHKAYYEQNKEERIKYATDYRIENKVDMSEKEKIRYRIKNPKILSPNDGRTARQIRKARLHNLPSTLTTIEWQSIKSTFNNRCVYCGEEKPLVQEHFIPLSKGGEYTSNNIIPSCSFCNGSKFNKDFFKWYPKFKYYSIKREQIILKYLNYKNNNQQLTLAL